jgi:kynurenine formamidase
VRAAARPRAAPFGFTRVVFLSHVLTAGGPTFPGDPQVEIHPAATIERDGYHLQSLVAGEQAGTHWAAPAHFGAGQAAADELDPGDFFYPAVVLDVRAEAKEDADFALGVAEILRWEAEFGPIPAHSAVVMWTGFGDRWDDPPAYLNADAAGRPHYPGFGAGATRWLIEERSIGALGISRVGSRSGRRYLVRRQPAAARRASHSPGEPGRAGRDAAVRRLDHRGRYPDTRRLGLAGHRVRPDPVTAADGPGRTGTV